MDRKQNIERFRSIMANVKRPGIDKLMEFIEKKSDFYKAPASTHFHLSCEGGLLQHSLNVYDTLAQLKGAEPFKSALARCDMQSIAIAALLHDLCKTMYYKATTRNVKNDQTGQWEKVPYYNIDDQIPYGHGEKSVMMVESYMRLTNAERYAIRWHMGGFEPQQLQNTVNAAFSKYPLAVALHIADLFATNVMEDTNGNKVQAPKSPEFEHVD